MKSGYTLDTYMYVHKEMTKVYMYEMTWVSIGSFRGSPNGTIGNFTNRTIGRANGTISITIGTNGITNGTIGKTLNDIGIPLVPLGNPERTH